MSLHWAKNIPMFGTAKSLGSVTCGWKVGAQGNTTKQQVRLMFASFRQPTVLVWEPLGGVGHASLFIQPSMRGMQDEVCYVSWFPGDDVDTGESGAGRKHLLPGRMLDAETQGFMGDCMSEADPEGTTGVGKDENGHVGKQFRLPEFVKALPSLNNHQSIAEMQYQWNVIRGNNDAHYRLQRKNCSTIVARVLRAGMKGSQHAKALRSSHKAWWTPYDVKVLADNI
jgi:hypothetical protein